MIEMNTGVLNALRNQHKKNCFLFVILYDQKDNFHQLNSAKRVIFRLKKKVNLIEMLMNKSISCLCNSKHIKQKFPLKSN